MLTGRGKPFYVSPFIFMGGVSGTPFFNMLRVPKMKEKIKQIAVDMARENGLINLSREELCKRANIPTGSFPHWVGCSFTEFVNQITAEVGEAGYHHKVNKTRANPEIRKTQILNSALQLSIDKGYKNVTRADVATRACISESLVSRYYSTMKQLQRAVIRTAVKQEILTIIAQGLVMNDDHANKAPKELKQKAMNSIVG